MVKELLNFEYPKQLNKRRKDYVPPISGLDCLVLCGRSSKEQKLNAKCGMFSPLDFKF
jgi:hypothetical protein